MLQDLGHDQGPKFILDLGQNLLWPKIEGLGLSHGPLCLARIQWIIGLSG